jgi:hypothetical protein
MKRLLSRLTKLLAILAALALALLLVWRDGGCDRTPPDDEEPVPADCKPGDKGCYSAEPTGTPGG